MNQKHANLHFYENNLENGLKLDVYKATHSDFPGRLVKQGGKGARATPIRLLTLNLIATHPKIPHGHSPWNSGATGPYNL